MRRNIVHPGADELIYEIRQIVSLGKSLEKMGVPITWENIGDPIQKGEKVAPWIKEIVTDLIQDDQSWAYTATQGYESTRDYLALKVNERGGTKITPDDILFFNGLGDAVAKIFAFMKREARILGPSPAYSTYSSAEAAHSGYEHLTYELKPENGWMPDMQEIENKIKYNDSIAGILLINPDNPTGAVFDKEILSQFVKICEKYDCILICDETYAHVNFSGNGSIHLSEVIGDKACGMALRSISKELPWPGSRCGWIEVFNRKKDHFFDRYIKSLIDAKMLEVCSTTLPQMAIPRIYSSPELLPHFQMRNDKFKKRAEMAMQILKEVPGISVVEPRGGFFLTVVFDEGVLRDKMKLEITNVQAKNFIETLLQNSSRDRRFILYLMASTGICVVPLSSFCSAKDGFRITLLEENPDVFEKTYQTLARSIRNYLKSI
ncbi:MAG: pyridoxal phosphate-dependent aminotransferase [Leptospiraceae bacterium]|nr:pyridoxal phosphate-dependent aminotransferase [Leptospiraceae bacterium]MCP5512363.1 pyridoxal phosphate-dependent aminotransferase [Leptospiraceae bacterium]